MKPLTVTVTTTTHTVNLTIPSLPRHPQAGHIKPGLHQHSLISTGVELWNAGCKVIYIAHHVDVLYNGNKVMTGHHNAIGLWAVKLPRNTPQLPMTQCRQQANLSVYTALTKKAITFHHWALFAPTKSTLLVAIKNNHFIGWPTLSQHNVR
jgi:hypothetical protein